MWAFDVALLDINPVAAQLSVVPFALGMLRYALIVELGHGGAPEDVVLSDRPLQLIGLSWLVVFAVGVRLGR
jgi:decaprenyl-phosphate phosphoribosyltransferase